MNRTYYTKAVRLMIVTITCQCINLLRDILLASAYGTSSINDIYLVSQTIISVIITMINSPMATAYVPVATKYYVNSTHEQRELFVSIVYSDIFVIAIFLTITTCLMINPIVQIAAPGFNYDEYSVLKSLVLLQSPIIFINIIKGINRGNFQILQKFNISELTNIFPYTCMCMYLLFPTAKNIYVIVIILSTATIISIIPEYSLLHKTGIRFKFKLAINNDIKSLLLLMGAASITAGIREINILFDKAIGSLLPSGSITMLSYASKLTVVVIGLISTSVSLIGFSDIARYSALDDKTSVKDSIVQSCNFINLLIIPVSIYLIIFADDIIRILFYRGSFSMESVQMTANIMRLYAIGLIGYGFQDIYTRALHAHKIVKCTLKESLLMVTINICLNLILYRHIGAYGVAIATSVSILFVIPVLGSDVKKYIGAFNRKKIFFELIKVYIASILTAILIYCSKCFFINQSIAVFVMQSFSFFIMYVSLAYLTKVEIVCDLVRSILSKFKIIN